MSNDLIKDVTPTTDDEYETSILEDVEETSEEISIEELGDSLHSSIDGGSTKPVCSVNTEATIQDVTLKIHKEKSWTKKGDDWYYPISVSIETQLKTGETSYDNYSGLRQTSNGNLWTGERSQFGRLVQLVKEETDAKNFEQVFKYLSKGRKVKVKTEESSFNGKTYRKNLIKQFI